MRAVHLHGEAARILSVDKPDPPLPPDSELLLDRGPYTFDGERGLMRQHAVTLLVTKNSGGDMTRAKLDAADTLGVAVVMVDRPALPDGVCTVSTVEAAVDWVSSRR